MADENLMEKLCFQWIGDADVDTLTGLCEEYKMVVAPEKAGKKEYLLKLVYRYLSGPELDDNAEKGKAVFTKLFNELGEKIGLPSRKTDTKVKKEPD